MATYYKPTLVKSTNLRREVRVKGEVNKEPSKTIPGEALSIREILGRAIRGMDIRMMERNGIFEDDPNYDSDLMKLRRPDNDLTDIDRISSRAKRTIEIARALKQEEENNEPVKPPPTGVPDEIEETG